MTIDPREYDIKIKIDDIKINIEELKKDIQMTKSSTSNINGSLFRLHEKTDEIKSSTNVQGCQLLTINISILMFWILYMVYLYSE